MKSIDDGWDKFWLTRNAPMSQKQVWPFAKNYQVISRLISAHFKTTRWGGLISCEVGAGRGTISDLLNVYGIQTHCTDLKDRLLYSNHYFHQNDITRDAPIGKGMFDIVFTYGLLEHFDSDNRYAACLRMYDMLRPGGLCLHYIVPKKWTNMFEDRSVPRYDCSEYIPLYSKGGSQWYCGHEQKIINVYPWHGRGDWECNEFWSKGFFMYNIEGN